MVSIPTALDSWLDPACTFASNALTSSLPACCYRPVPSPIPRHPDRGNTALPGGPPRKYCLGEASAELRRQSSNSPGTVVESAALDAAPCRLGHGASGRRQVAWRRQGGSVFDRRAAIAETVRTLPAEYSNAGWPAIVPPPKHCTRAGWPPATYGKSPLNFGRPRPTKVGIAGADTS